jgi:peptide/nickel transport system substrate-binding protein
VEPSASPEPELTDEQKSFLETLVIALPKSPTTLAPASSVGESTFVVTGNTYDHLIEYAPGGSEIGPSLATEWDVSDDGMAYVFRLRDDVKFHDGTMLDAEAVKFGFGRAPGMERRTSLLVRNYPPKRVNSIYGESR